MDLRRLRSSRPLRVVLSGVPLEMIQALASSSIESIQRESERDLQILQILRKQHVDTLGEVIELQKQPSNTMQLNALSLKCHSSLRAAFCKKWRGLVLSAIFGQKLCLNLTKAARTLYFAKRETTLSPSQQTSYRSFSEGLVWWLQRRGSHPSANQNRQLKGICCFCALSQADPKQFNRQHAGRPRDPTGRGYPSPNRARLF